MDQAVFIEGTPWKHILKFALPLMAASLLQQLYSTVDTLVIGNLESQTALSAVGSCAYLVSLYLALAQGFSLGAGVLVSQYFGAGNEKYKRNLRQHGKACVGKSVAFPDIQ